MSVWVRAARPATLTAAIAPVLVGSAIPAAGGHFAPGVFVAALLGAVLIQVGANFANDLFDFRRGADRPTRLGPARMTATGAVSQRAIAVATGLAFAASAACGVYLVVVGGVPIVIVGLASIVAAVTYVGGPWPYGYRGLGEVMCFLFFGVVPVATLDYLHRGSVSPAALLASIPLGCLITAVLVVNNLRDIDDDRASGKRTLAVLIGAARTRIEWKTLLALAYLVPPAGWAAGLWSLPGALMPLLTLSLAVKLAARIDRVTGRELNLVLRDNARLSLLFGALFALGILVTRPLI